MRWMLAGCLAAALAGCAAPSPNNGGAMPQATAAPPSALTVAATPFLVLAKIPTCIVTLVVAVPLAVTSEFTPPDDPDSRDLRRNLDAGVDANCGPPYVVTP